ncbi:Sensors of blue-light using FAD [Microbacterium sp. ru370.1]|uniref:BLUF domain-containing protein n=1 Tax=unclassified Microbacterium TaxID=2609290 RepID=UPI0008857639|nr:MULTISPECIES: BLUF domain-containing protein [unclassified Microbacterium]SDO31228.1 Sensors of blue-light using FAD [Microbacterium sp. ru370.1]SIT76324.1 Sensors of blue-light using FAD [Microbacterium sp. RU1D]
MSAPLTAVSYVSRAVEEFDDARLADLLAQSRRSNHEHDLSGMLLHRRGRFFQVLEGPKDAVDELMTKIRRDSRHDEVRVLLTEQIEERRFNEWTMGYEPIGVTSTPVPEGFRDTFDDLESDDDDASIRAVRELTVWFRARTAAA